MPAGWWAETIITPALASLVLTGGIPGVKVTNNVTITPAPAVLTLTGGTPAAGGPVITPAPATLALTGGTPTVTIGRTLSPAPATLALTGDTPSVVKNTILRPAAAALALTGGTPTVTNLSPASYDAIGASNTGFGSMSSFNFTASSGADVFVGVNWDRSGASVTGVTCGGTAMSLVASLVHNNTTGLGGISVYRLAGAGNGSAKAIAVTVSGGAWYIANAVSAKSVSSMGTALTAFGSSTTASQSLTVASGLVLQFISSANGGSGVGDYTSFSGVTNRWHLQSTGGAMAINTVTATGTASSTASGSQPWAAIAVPLT